MDIFDLYDRFSINLCQDTTNNIRDLIKTTEEKLKELASEVVTNSSTLLSPTQGKISEINLERLHIKQHWVDRTSYLMLVVKLKRV